MACLESLLIVRDGRPYKFARAGTRPPLKLGHDVVAIVVEKKGGKRREEGEEKRKEEKNRLLG